MQRHVGDKYVKEATQHQLRSRAYFKLSELQDKYKLISPDDFVVDLGAAPGGWSLFASKLLKFENRGKLVSVDLLEFTSVPFGQMVLGDFSASDVQAELVNLTNGRLIDVILSDMLQNTCGVKEVDHLQSLSLCESVLQFALIHLKTGGNMLCKYLQGRDEQEFLKLLRKHFRNVKVVKPKASRAESNEIYALCLGKF